MKKRARRSDAGWVGGNESVVWVVPTHNDWGFLLTAVLHFLRDIGLRSSRGHEGGVSHAVADRSPSLPTMLSIFRILLRTQTGEEAVKKTST